MFYKNIERNLRGVIKVGQEDEASIEQELDEYVVTRELQKHLSKFYDNYQKGIDGDFEDVGVWISGFFGSGKSHFLKILSYLLKNHPVKGKNAIDYFEDKIQDPMVLANMKRTADIETEVILFNIDSKSSLDGKSKEDAILKVFMKVFYEHRGYYGDIPGVAEMEKYLDQQGLYDDFKREFNLLAGEEWVDRRNTFYFDADFVIGALTKVTDMTEETARNWFENGVNNFEISIEKFAKDVKEYVDQKGKKLVFLVDEIGQYIGDNRQLMLNLQTVTENIGTYCKGKVWLGVTAQESIDSLMKVKGDDFSRIQGRFNTRLSLSSISVDEVIKERILAKQDFVMDTLKQLYLSDNNSAKLKNTISFKGEVNAEFRGYDDENEFAEIYPFVPYQFKLLQSIFEQVRKHGSSGKHLSEGERSMLSAFQESALQFKDYEEGTLIPLHAFYETIREFLSPSVARVIEGAYQNQALNDDPFNIDVLKVLFMIKYIEEIPANVDNLSTLMVTNIDEDKLKLKEKLQESLRKLTAQNLIQKNGEVYVFLTDDEQDINRDIKETKIEEEVIKRELASYIFDDIFDNKAVRYKKEHSFSFNRIMDEKHYRSQTSTLGLNIISSLSDNYTLSDRELMMETYGKDEVLIKLEGNEYYQDEMEQALQIEEYKKRKNVHQMPENMQIIIQNKQFEAKERRRRVRELLNDGLRAAKFYINGENVNVKGGSAKEKITNSLVLLIESVYEKLDYVKEHVNSNNDLLTILRSDNEATPLFNTAAANELAYKDVKNHIDLQHEFGRQMRVKPVLDHFQAKPYGWRELDIAGLIAQLWKEQYIRLSYKGEYIEPVHQSALNALIKSSETDMVIVTKRVKVDDALLRTARRITKEVFNKTDLSEDEDGLVHEIKGLIQQERERIKAYKQRYEGRKYPGESILDKGLEYFEQFNERMDNAAFFTKLKELEEDLLDWEEDVTYVTSFFDNQKSIFDQGMGAIDKYQENRHYLTSDDIQDAVEQLKDIVEDPIPYNKIKDIPPLAHKIDEAIEHTLVDKKQHAKTYVEEVRENLKSSASQYGVTDQTKQRLEKVFQDLLSSIDQYTNIYKVDATITHCNNYKTQFERKIDANIQAAQREKEQEEIKETEAPPATRSVSRVRIKNIVDTNKRLKNEQDIDTFVENLSKELKQMIIEDQDIEFID